MDNLTGCIPVLFTRVPVPGFVKTRLETRLAPEQCAALQYALAIDLAERVSAGFDDMVLCYSDEWTRVAAGVALRDGFVSRVIEVCAPSCRVHLLAQEGEGLGCRMAAATAQVFAAGACGCVLFGSDLPDVGAADVLAVRDALAGCDAVFGPGEDGGYWAVGLNEPFPELFTCCQFSTDSVLSDALATCEGHRKAVRLVRTAADIDDLEALDRLIDGALACGPHVRRVLASFS